MHSDPQRSCQTPQVKGSVPEDCRHLGCQPLWGPQVAHISAQPTNIWGFLSFPPTVENLLEQLTGLRKTLLARSVVYYKGCDPGTAVKRYTGQGTGYKGCGPARPSSGIPPS